jgi:hypothetical protein
MLKDEKLIREEFFKNYTKEEIVSYVEELYNRGDNLELIKKEFNKINFDIDNKKEMEK